MSCDDAKSVAWIFASPGVGYAPANQFSPSSEIQDSHEFEFGEKPFPTAKAYLRKNRNFLESLYRQKKKEYRI